MLLSFFVSLISTCFHPFPCVSLIVSPRFPSRFHPFPSRFPPVSPGFPPFLQTFHLIVTTLFVSKTFSLCSVFNRSLNFLTFLYRENTKYLFLCSKYFSTLYLSLKSEKFAIR